MKKLTPMRALWLAVFFLGLTLLVEGQTSSAPGPGTDPLVISASDVVMEAHEDGIHLFVKKKEGLESVLLAESFEPSDHKLATYTYRALTVNPVNGNEDRLLDGKFLKKPHYSLISSTPVDYPALGKAFHILIPNQVEFGYKNYPNARYGLVDLQKVLGAEGQTFWFSIRAFSKPYADYTGSYKENAFELKKMLLAQTPVDVVSGYNEGLFEKFSRLGTAYPAKNANEGLDLMKKKLEDSKSESLDIVLCIDTTKSMVESLKVIKANALNPIRDLVKKFKTFRIGVVFYRDYMEEYLTKSVAFQTDLDKVQVELDRAVADGGGDIPEAVVEALYAALNRFDWQADSRLILLMGDAPQHPSPRGSVTEPMVKQLAQDKNVEIQMVMLPVTNP